MSTSWKVTSAPNRWALPFATRRAMGEMESQCDGYAARASADVENSAIGKPNRRMLCDEATEVLGLWAWYQDAGLYMEGASAEVGYT